MPRGDGTGPMGMGPMTGRGAGICAGSAVLGSINASGMFGGFGCRRGAGGKGRGFGFQARNRFVAQPYAGVNAPAANEQELLTNQMSFLEKQLQQVKQRLDSISSKTE